MEIRQAKLYDVPAIARIEENTSTAPWSAAVLTDDVVKNKNAYVGVATDNSEVIGYADMWLIVGEAQLNNIGIEAEYRGKGFGEALLRHMVDKATELDCFEMNLEVRVSNEAARGLYQKLGFREVGIRKGYYRDTHEDAILMTKNLAVTEGHAGGQVSIDIEL